MHRDHDLPGPGGRRLWVREDGDPGGVPLITHHGTPGSRVLLPAAVRSAEARGIRLIAYDRPGYGGSTAHPGRRVVDAAADVAAIADALGLDRILVDGASGGGPHALACAARLADRVAAVLTCASVAPHDADGLDFAAGMGDDNVDEFAAAMAGRAALEPLVAGFRASILASSAEALAGELRSVISAADAAVLTGELAETLFESVVLGLAGGVEGWIGDDLAFVRPWGFDVAEVTVPYSLWQGEQDMMVPPAHGRWLAAHVPGVEVCITPDDGHLTLSRDDLVDEQQAWLLERFAG